ncbi:MAG: hypothetical protein EP343_02455 [Deltaproteobacteria bacterium]|nr:MAG: hypothetical protein EP343_02455 [Deltaproteobacteria bacterium]
MFVKQSKKWSYGVLAMLALVFAFVACSPADNSNNSTTDGGTSTEATTGEETTGSTEATTGEDAGTTQEATPEESTGTKKWADMTFDEKRAYMSSTVLPAVAALFKEYDSTRFGQVGCTLCHGTDMVAKKFKMPNGIRPFSPQNVPSQGKGVDFMKQKLMPKMIELLGLKPFDPSTGKGFGCFSCHGTK